MKTRSHPTARRFGGVRRSAALPLVAAFAVALTAVLAFVAVLPNSRFVFDDHVLIEKNALLHAPNVWSAAFGRDYFATSENPGGSGYFRPIAVIADAVDVRIWRKRAWGYHVTNLALHAAASIALAPALIALGVAAPAAWIAALVFAAHPSHAESVAFISGRGDVLAGLWIFVTLILAGSRRRFATVAFGLSALCAYLSKEAAIVLPALVFLQSRIARQRDAQSVAATRSTWQLRWAVFAVVSLVALLLRYAALGRFLPASAAGSGGNDSLWLPLQSLGFMIASLYAPVRRLAMEPSPALLSALHLGIGVMIAGALWFAAWRVDPAGRAALRRAGFATLIAVLPVLNWMPQETQLSERFLYLASGFALVPIGVLVQAGWRHGAAWRPWVTGVTALAVLVCLWISSWRAQAWRDDIGLWTIATTEEPDRALFWNRYGLALMERSRLVQSEAALRRAIELDPRDFAAQHYLGMILHRTDRYAAAIAQYRKALELRPRDVLVHLNIGLSWLARGNAEEAYEAAKQALALQPTHFEALRFAGGCALQLGRLPEARTLLEAARRQQPENPMLQQPFEVLERRESGLEQGR